MASLKPADLELPFQKMINLGSVGQGLIGMVMLKTILRLYLADFFSPDKVCLGLKLKKCVFQVTGLCLIFCP